jgi:hypothetical protein
MSNNRVIEYDDMPFLFPKGKLITLFEKYSKKERKCIRISHDDTT